MNRTRAFEAALDAVSRAGNPQEVTTPTSGQKEINMIEVGKKYRMVYVGDLVEGMASEVMFEEVQDLTTPTKPSLKQQCAKVLRQQMLDAGYGPNDCCTLNIPSAIERAFDQITDLMSASPKADTDGWLPWPGANPFNFKSVVLKFKRGGQFTAKTSSVNWADDEEIVAFKPVNND